MTKPEELTPRTDRQTARINAASGHTHWVPAELARQLEGELAEVTRELEQARRVEQVCYDLHHALGVEWGSDPYAAIRALQQQQEQSPCETCNGYGLVPTGESEEFDPYQRAKPCPDCSSERAESQQQQEHKE